VGALFVVTTKASEVSYDNGRRVMVCLDEAIVVATVWSDRRRRPVATLVAGGDCHGDRLRRRSHTHRVT